METHRGNCGVVSLFTSPVRALYSLTHTSTSLRHRGNFQRVGLMPSGSTAILWNTVTSNTMRPVRRLNHEDAQIYNVDPHCGLLVSRLTRLFSTLWDTVMLSETHPHPALGYTPGV
jgi:hypothetical protein